MSLIEPEFHIAYKMNAPFTCQEEELIEQVLKKFRKDEITIYDIGPKGISQGIDYKYTLGKAQLNLRQELGIYGVSGGDYNDVDKAFKTLGTILFKSLKISKKEVKFIEVVSKGRYKPAILPNKSMRNILHSKDITTFNKFFDGKSGTTPLVFAVCIDTNAEPTSPFKEMLDWHEFKIQPFPQNPRFYLWQLVYRRGDQKKALSFWKDLPIKIEKILKAYNKRK